MQTVFKRYESKYFVSPKQMTALYQILGRFMAPDSYGNYIVQNIYYDTDNWDVIRASIEKPLYKEKMRLRCYGIPSSESNLFLELKKKHEGIVYKRRMAIPAESLPGSHIRNALASGDLQIARELDFYMKTNAVSKKILISYHRAAFTGIEDKGLRITFDTVVRFRLNNLNFDNPHDGRPALPPDKIIMEIKTPDAMPLWLAHALSETSATPTSFSKYGACYNSFIAGAPYCGAKKIPASRMVIRSA